MDSLVIFATAATAIVIEAAPFLLLGSLIGAAIEVFVSEQTLQKLIPNNGPGQVFVGLFAGMLLPTCECGIVPVARRLLLKGVPPRAAIPYMMAAPVVNPVVIGSTLFAFQGDLSVAFYRVLLVVVPASVLGLALGKAGPELVLRSRPVTLQQFDKENEHDHGPDCACDCTSDEGGRFKRMLTHTSAEFLSMARFLIIGAMVAAGFKTLLPPSILELIMSNPFMAVGGLMILAVLLSICSEADAFVAASFASFPMMSKVAFMAIGPMVDLKLIPMFLSVFNRRVAIALIVIPSITVYIMATLFSLGGF